MPLGLWKSKWEIHREDMECFRGELAKGRAEAERRNADWREELARRDAGWRKESERRDAGWREEVERRDAEWREETKRYRSEVREERAKSDARQLELREECRDLRADYDREIAESRLFNRELLIRIEKTHANLSATLKTVGDELRELKAAVTAQTDAIMKLVDRFEDSGGSPPV